MTSSGPTGEVQLELTDYRAPVTEPEEVDRLIALLAASGTWMTAREILEQLGLPVTETTKRTLRDWASHSHGQVGSGQAGYKSIRHMTNEEYNHFRNAMTSQADAMRARVIESDKQFYGRKPL